RLLQAAPRFPDVALIQQRHAVIVIVLRRVHADLSLFQAAVAHGDMQSRALRYIALGTFGGVAKQIARLLQLAGVEQLHSGFERGELFLRADPLAYGHGALSSSRAAGILRWLRHASVGHFWRRTLLFLRHI